MAYTKAKSNTPARPAPLTEEERAAKVAMFLQQKRESYALSILAGLVHNPSLVQMASIRESVKGDGFTHTISVDLSPAVDAAVAAADALIDKLYPKKEGAE